MSTFLIVNIAFLVGCILSYKLLKKVVKNALKNKRNKTKFSSEETEKFRKDMLEYHKKLSTKYETLGLEVSQMMEEALDTAANIIEHNRQQIDHALKGDSHSNLKKITDQFEKTIKDLKANTPNVAADAIKKIMHKNKDDNRSSEVVSSFSRNLNKKLH